MGRRGKHALRLTVGLLCGLGLLVGGCANQAGIAEFQAYAEVFDESASISASIVDMVAATERANNRKALQTRYTLPASDPNRLNAGEFRGEDAPYWVDSLDPPLAASYRDGLSTVAAFNSTMIALATGQTAEIMRAEAAKLSGASIRLASSLGLAAGIAPALAAFEGLALELAEIGLQYQTREVFRQTLIDKAPKVGELLKVLRDGSPTLFKTIASAEIPTVIGGLAAGKSPSQVATAQSELEKKRRLISGWYLLMKRMMVALDHAIDAAKSPSSKGQLAVASRAIADMDRAVAAMKATLASLRTL